MSSSCPGCGAEMEFADQEVRLRTGQCASCHHEYVLLEGTALPVPHPVEGETGSAAAAPEASGLSVPDCEECGSPLSLRRRRDGSIEARCDECESTTIFVPRAEAEEEVGEKEPPRRRWAPEGTGGPRGRPCRQCGAPLRFSTNEEGLLVGECEACGNRFTLPPREGRGGDTGRFRRGSGPRGRPYGDRRGRPGWGGPPRAGGTRSRRFRPDSYESEGDDRRTRRRRRSDR